MRRRILTEVLENRALLAGDVMYNEALPTDVNADGYTSPLDALYVINELNTGGARSLKSDSAPSASGLFYDVNNDTYLTPMDALLVLNDLGAEGEDGDLVQIRLQPTDLSGNPISTIEVGEDFQLRVFVQDLTGRASGGVFAAYVDVEYNSSLASVAGEIVHGSAYGNAKSGNTASAGLIDEAGSIDGLNPLGASELLLFTVPMKADAAGAIDFQPNQADLSPAHDVLVYGVPTGETSPVVAPDRIAYLSASLQIGSVATPVAVDDSYQVAKNQVLIVGVEEGVLDNDTVPGGGTLTAAVATQPTHGSLVLSANGSFSYTPAADFVGSDTFTYTASAGGVASAPATVTIEVVAPNVAPVAVDDTYSVNEDTTLTSTLSVLANDTDADGDTLTANLVTQPTHGTLTLGANGQFTYVPAANFHGTDSFVYRANDGTVDSNTATATITINPINDPPTAVADAYSVAAGETLNVSAANGLLDNDSDLDGDALTVILLTGPAQGDLDLNSDGSFSYTPAVGFVGVDTFTYAANDGIVNSAAATVSITVTGDRQVRIRLETTNLTGTPISSIGLGGQFLLRGYVQDISSAPQDGVFAAYLDVVYDAQRVGVNGEIVYGATYPNQQSGDTTTPGLIDEVGAFDGLNPLGAAEFLLFSVPMVANQGGTANFTSDGPDLLPAHDILLYNINQPIPADEVEFGTTVITIVAGDPPVAVDDAYQTDEDVSLVVNAEAGVLANDSDPNDDQLTAVLVTGPAHGSLTLNDNGSFTYTPDDDFNGEDSFTYRANDGAASSNLATVVIDINPVDDAPVAVNDAYRIDDASPLTVDAANGVLANDFDVDGDALTAVLVEGVDHGAVVLNSDGSFTYTPDTGFVGRDTFTYRAIAAGVQSEIATVTIDVGDLTPSSISGFVYADVDNDGIMDNGEARYGGVQITLKGTDLLGRTVSRSSVSQGDGSYRFDNVLRGSYTLTEVQPLFLVDGKDTINGELSLRNDRFLIELPASTAAGNYNFGERGLQAKYITNPMFFASRTSHGMLAAYDGAGLLAWYCLDGSWSGLDSVDSQLTVGRSAVEVTVFDDGGVTDTDTISLVNNRNARMVGNPTDGYMVKLTGDMDDFGINPVFAGESELDSAAVDAAFGGEDA